MKTKKREEVGTLKILKETPEEWVRMDVQMDDSLVDLLVDYAKKNMSKEEIRSELINWAFLDVLKKQITREKRK